MVVGLIPARGGSKGIPRKNVALLSGRPLIAWTLEAARGSSRLDRIAVSTDDAEIAAIARVARAEVVDRPAELAADDTPMRDVILHALDALGEPEVLVLLQPTSPLRRAEHVDAAVALLEETGADAVVSVVEVPHAFAPASLMELDGDRLRPLDPTPYPTRADKPRVYARNGPAVLVLRTAGLRERSGLFAGDCRAYPMEPRDSLDVDDAFDLEVAEFLLGRR